MSINKIVGLSSLVLVIGAAGSGLYLSGPPGEQRLVRQDQQLPGLCQKSQPPPQPTNPKILSTLKPEG